MVRTALTLTTAAVLKDKHCVAVLGGRAAERQERNERAMVEAATSATTETVQLPTPTRMLSMAEIRAHTAASARLKRKAAAHAILCNKNNI